MLFSKLAIVFIALALVSSANAYSDYNGTVDPQNCMEEAEQAALQEWRKKSASKHGWIMSGGTDVIWVRGNVVSYQLSVVTQGLGSSSSTYINYSVRMRDTGRKCETVKIRRF